MEKFAYILVFGEENISWVVGVYDDVDIARNAGSELLDSCYQHLSNLRENIVINDSRIEDAEGNSIAYFNIEEFEVNRKYFAY